MRTPLVLAVSVMMFGCGASTAPPVDGAAADAAEAASDSSAAAAVADASDVASGPPAVGVTCGDTRCRPDQLCVELGSCGCVVAGDGGCPLGTHDTDPYCNQNGGAVDAGATCFYQTFSGAYCADTCACAGAGYGCRCTGADGGVQTYPGCY